MARERREETMTGLDEVKTQIGELSAAVDARFRDLSRGFDRRFDEVDKRFQGVDKRLDGIDGRLDAMDKRLDGIDRQLTLIVTLLTAR